ncbi:MAG TPA: hypothetical protein VI365_05175 [Trebonia sp.]
MARTLTPKGAATRGRIVEGAAAEIRESGVTATLDDILVRTGTSKSQLFHYCEISADLDAERTAAALLAGIQGGVVMMMSAGDTAPLEAALDLGIEYLRAHRPR